MKKRISFLVVLAVMLFSLSISAYAAETGVWLKAADGRYWFLLLEKRAYYADCWKIINGKWYFFDSDGYLITNADYGDGRTIGGDGVALMNGEVILPEPEEIEEVGVVALDASHTVPSSAGTWIQYPDGRWFHMNQDSTYTTDNWQMIDGKWYYFDANGFMLTNTTTPDGYRVGADGAMVESSSANTSSASTSSSTSSNGSQYAYLAAADFRGIKSQYSNATPTGAYIKSFTMDGDRCVLVVVRYKIIQNYEETFLHNITKGSRITDPDSYYKSQANRAFGGNKIKALNRHSAVLEAYLAAVKGGEYVSPSVLDPQ